jgi:hypothetical protein
VAGIKPNNKSSPGPIGNTQGLIVPKTSPNASGENNSAPPPEPQPKEEGWWGQWGSAATHGLLDSAGLIPVLGEPANLVGAMIYLAEGDKIGAAMDAAAAWPVGGQAATVAKYAMKAEKAVVKQIEKEAAQAVAKQAEKKAAKELEEAAAKKAAKPQGGNIKGSGQPKLEPKPKKVNKPRQPQTYEKKVRNADGSTTYTLRKKDGNTVNVTYNNKGYPDFSSHKYDGTLGKNEVQINMTGNNNVDFKQANKEAGFGETKRSHPDDYTWHHHEDGNTMQLIKTDVHEVTPHTGGASAARRSKR